MTSDVTWKRCNWRRVAINPCVCPPSPPLLVLMIIFLLFFFFFPSRRRGGASFRRLGRTLTNGPRGETGGAQLRFHQDKSKGRLFTPNRKEKEKEKEAPPPPLALFVILINEPGWCLLHVCVGMGGRGGDEGGTMWWAAAEGICSLKWPTRPRSSSPFWGFCVRLQPVIQNHKWKSSLSEEKCYL